MKRAREQALKERRERKREKKAARATSGPAPTADTSPAEDSIAPTDKDEASADQPTSAEDDVTIEISK